MNDEWFFQRIARESRTESSRASEELRKKKAEADRQPADDFFDGFIRQERARGGEDFPAFTNRWK